MMALMRALLLLLAGLVISTPALAQKPGPNAAQPVQLNPRYQTEPYEQVRERNERQQRRDEGRENPAPLRAYPDTQASRQTPDLPSLAPVSTSRNTAASTAASQVDVDRVLPFLAYTLGELHYLAFACDGTETQTWRDQMLQLLALEAETNGRRREELIENFNDGYRVQQRYRPVCGAQAEAERRALAYRGRDLSEMMRSAYFD